MSFAEKFRSKAEEYHERAEHAPSVLMRAWYEGLERSYTYLAEDEERFYSRSGLPVVDAGPVQPSAPDLQALDELEAELAAHFAKRENETSST